MKVRRRKVLKGPCVGKVSVELQLPAGLEKDVDIHDVVKDAFLENGLLVGRAQVIEGFVEDILRTCDEGPLFGEVLIAVPPFEVVEVMPNEEPWEIRLATSDDREMISLCRDE